MPEKLKIFKKASKILFKNFFSCIAVAFPMIFIAVVFYLSQIIMTKYLERTAIDFSEYLFFANNSFLINILPFVFGFLFLLFFSPLYYGIFLWFIELSKGNRHCFYEVFGYYTSLKLFFKSVWFNFRIAAANIVLIMPFLIFLSSSLFVADIIFNYSGNAAFLLLGLFLCLLALSVVFFLMFMILSSRYIAAQYIFVTNPDMTIKNVIKYSKKAMYGFKAHVLSLEICLIPMLLLCLLVTPVLFILPFAAICLSLYITEVCRKTNIKSVNDILQRNSSLSSE